MAIRFNADEIFEMAERIEENGAKFYRRAAEIFKGSGSDELLRNLAAMEDEHKATFATMRAMVSEPGKKVGAFDPDNETKKYLQAIADGEVFDVSGDACTKLCGKESLPEIIKTAIGLEKDSIVFYLAMKRMVPPDLGKDQMDRIIKEEESHIAILVNVLKPFES